MKETRVTMAPTAMAGTNDRRGARSKAKVWDRTLIVIRERSQLEIFDLTMRVWREKAGVLLGASVVGIVPFEILNWFILGSDPEFYWSLLVVILEAPLATAALTVVLGRVMFGERLRVKEIGKTIIRAGFGLILLQGIIRNLLLITVVLSFVVPQGFSFVNEVLLLERAKTFGVFARVSNLARDREGGLLGCALLQLLLGALFVAAFNVSMSTMGGLLIGEWARELIDWQAVIAWLPRMGAWIAVSFFTVSRFLTYIDQRVRIEGWEVELRLKSVSAKLAEWLIR